MVPARAAAEPLCCTAGGGVPALETPTLGLALAALLAVGGVELDGGHDLGERGHLTGGGGGLGGLDHGRLDVGGAAGAAALGGEGHSGRGLVLAGGLLADELALGAGAHEGLAALPVARGGLAERRAQIGRAHV